MIELEYGYSEDDKDEGDNPNWIVTRKPLDPANPLAGRSISRQMTLQGLAAHCLNLLRLNVNTSLFQDHDLFKAINNVNGFVRTISARNRLFPYPSLFDKEGVPLTFASVIGEGRYIDIHCVFDSYAPFVFFHDPEKIQIVGKDASFLRIFREFSDVLFEGKNPQLDLDIIEISRPYKSELDDFFNQFSNCWVVDDGLLFPEHSNADEDEDDEDEDDDFDTK